MTTLETQKAWRKANPEKVKQAQAKWNAANPGAGVAASTAWNKANPRKVHNAVLMRNYGITVEQYDAMLIAQSGRCAVCSRPMDPPHVDHDHVTGKVRKLLDGPCNRAAGMLQDDPEVATQLAMYLAEHKGVFNVY